jgi:mono/diheme cytochrome c family protein
MTEMRMRKCIGAFLVVLSISILGSTFIFAQEPVKKEPPPVPPQFNIGKLLYGKSCSSCHGVDLKGTEQGPPFLHRVYHPGHHGDGSFFLAVKRGVRAHHWKFGNMPPVEGIDDKMINAIVQYVRQVQKSAGLF